LNELLLVLVLTSLDTPTAGNIPRIPRNLDVVIFFDARNTAGDEAHTVNEVSFHLLPFCSLFYFVFVSESRVFRAFYFFFFRSSLSQPV
jgi:hypothetical protein